EPDSFWRNTMRLLKNPKWWPYAMTNFVGAGRVAQGEYVNKLQKQSELLNKIGDDLLKQAADIAKGNKLNLYDALTGKDGKTLKQRVQEDKKAIEDLFREIREAGNKYEIQFAPQFESEQQKI